MSIAFDHRDPGTAEADWLAVEPWHGTAAFTLVARRLIVLAAHPDDETLGAGGLIATAAADGVAVTIVVATDGEAAPDSPAAAALRLTRRLEVTTALNDLAPAAGLRFLGLPDGGLREAATPLLAALERELGDDEDVLVVAPWWGDGHRDHRVLGEAALRLRRDGVQVVGYPIWLWHWADPRRADTAGWLSLALSPAAIAAKARAVARHRSQLESARPHGAPVVHAGMAAHFARPFEVFIEPAAPVVPSVDPTRFEDLFRRHDDPWGFETRWYEERKRALLLAVLPRRRFRCALELGCATGALTAELAVRCDHVTGVDAVSDALAVASRRLADSAATLLRRTLPREWPDGRFDLIVLSELGYYWTVDDLAIALDRVDEALEDDGVLIACHWRHAIEGAPSRGDDVHAAIARRRGWARSARHVERDLLLDVYARPGAPSVAEAEGLR